MSTVKDNIRRLTEDGVRKSSVTTAPDYAPQSAAVRKTGTFVAPIADHSGGPVSPLTMVITATTTRSIPVPAGATSVEVEDASEFTLTDAEGVEYLVSSVTWPF